MAAYFASHLACALVVAAGAPSTALADPAGADFFEKRIRPVLAEQCYECHSATSPKVRGGLRVDSRAGLLRGGDSGPAIVPGKPDGSLLYAAITHRDKEIAMPAKKPKLPEAILADFERWIRDGAVWTGEESAPVAQRNQFDLEARKQRLPWIWETARRQPVPPVKDKEWARTDADRFILAKLEEKGLAPAPAADPRVWLRRVCFALVGLPPSPAEIHEFLADTSPRAREAAVERLLASPHFGERWARHWMDLVRYAESRGHESDYAIANAYHYRDYLIRAFNADVPYNQFVLEQVAGDLLPRPRLETGSGANESVLGTGWAFLGEEVHSPVDIRQDECDRIDNKVDVLSKTFLGLTVACARCHDHKFDAIAARDYYALSGFVLSSSYRQVRFESMEQNRRVARELEALRDQARPRIAAALATSCRPGLQRMADYLMAAQEAAKDLFWEQGRDSVEAVAEEHSLDAAILRRWMKAVDRAGRDGDDPLHLFASAARDGESGDSGRLAEMVAKSSPPQASALPKDARVVVDYSDPSRQPWKADGEAFGNRPLATGELCMGSDPAQPVQRIMPYAAARRDPFWNRLRIAPGNETDSGELAATSRAGQMVCTPTFTLGCGKLHYLLRGKTRVYAAVDSHLMIAGPLHFRLMQTFDSGSAGRPQWFTHDLSPYSGQRVHVEFGPVGESELELLMVVESNETPALRPGPAPWHPTTACSSLRSLAEALQRDLTSACEHLGNNSIARATDPAKGAGLANWLVGHIELFAGSPNRLGSRALAAQAAGNRNGVNAFASPEAPARSGGSDFIPAPERSNSASPAKRLPSALVGEETSGRAGDGADCVVEFCGKMAELEKKVRWESRTAVAWFDGTGVDESVLARGKPFSPGEVAPRGLPSAFPNARPIQLAASSGRYELAQQMIDPANPLVSRVIVNRVWHHLFGRGLVATVDNFGYLGERPTHPELLDELAWQFVHGDNWSLKRLIKRLVLSSTFAMSSKPSDERSETLDPANILLHRMPVRRLEAEAIRDALLAVSGRLNPAVCGPPVPVHLTEFVIGRGRPEQSGPLDGDGRRSIYTAVRRNFLPTMMLAYDMPTPFSTVGRRNVTNVPAQSLVLMNDPLFHEQAKVWAQRLFREVKTDDPTARLQWLFESAYARLPSAAEEMACRQTLAELETLQGPASTPIEVWTDLCHALLNANDFIYLK